MECWPYSECAVEFDIFILVHVVIIGKNCCDIVTYVTVPGKTDHFGYNFRF